MQLLQQALAQASNGDLSRFVYQYEFAAALDEIWSPPPPPPPRTSPHEELSFSESRALEDFGEVSFSLSLPDPSPWSIAFTPVFRKSVAGVDKKLQGRVLAALTELSEAPITPHGDTVKPLTGELKGLWRYRVGDFRLVYQPQEPVRTVVLLEFAPRGGVYE